MSFTVGISTKELEVRLEHLKERVSYLKDENIIYIRGFVFSQASSQKNNNFFALVKKKFDELPKNTKRRIVEFDLSLVEVLGADTCGNILTIDLRYHLLTYLVYPQVLPFLYGNRYR